MKQLKHIKLFEAFESIKLGKTLNFINTGAKSIFIDNLKKIASNYDFPISKFNDDMFEYLPFKSALMKNVDPPKPTEREVCKRESDWIPGEFCQGGRVKRTWGAHTRMTECPGCGGTGFKPERKVEPEIQLIKFWFDKDGNFVTVTGCDGQIRNQNQSYDKDKPIPEEKAYTWNNLIDLRWMSMNNARDMDVRLKNAHFAIILNLKKMKESDYEKVSSLKALRKQRKEGAFIQSADVKNANLERYISLLIKKFDANKGLSETPKILPRALGFTNSITFIIRGINFYNIDSLVSYIYNIIKDPNDSDYYQRNAMSSLEDIYNNFSLRSTQINQNIDSTWKLIDKGTSNKEVDKKISQYFEKYLELGEFIIKKVNSTKIETIYDIEVMMKKFQSIKNFVESTRIQSLRNLRYLSDYLYNSDANYVYSSMEETLDSYPSALNDLDDFRSAIEKILG